MMDSLSYFKETYEDSRLSFLKLAEASGGELRSHQITNDLTFESLYLPPASGNKKRLLIVSSGIHGIEGFTGSALQRYFLEHQYFGFKDQDMGILVLHGINPYGFKHKRRVTQNNVDLNRNFDITPDLFKIENEGYAKVYQFLNPGIKYSRLSFYTQAVLNILKYGMENLRKAILRGQYQFPEGIFFGGKDFEPQVPLIQKEIQRVGEGYEKVLLVDLHTGYGKRGKLHLFGDLSPYIDQKHMEEVFKSLPVDYGSEKDFYAVTGGFTVFMAKLFHEKSKFAGICFEFGTVDSHKTIGSMDSLYRMINEKQDQKLFEEMFYPVSKEWRSEVIRQFEASIKKTLSNWIES